MNSNYSSKAAIPLLTLDAFFLNEDRHTHNIAVLMNGKGQFRLCPIFDNGAALLSEASVYGMPERQRVENLLRCQTRKYAYLFR